MDSDEVVSRIVDEIRADGAEFNLDDPFDDPALVTTAFMDILWQDQHGNSALMLAAAENRVLQVKGILTMAINSGKLWQILDARNSEGLTCVEMATRAGSETCAMLITKVAREYAKLRPRPPGIDRKSRGSDSMMMSPTSSSSPSTVTTTTDDDVTFTLMKGNSASGCGAENMDESYVKELIRQSASASGHRGGQQKTSMMSRDKISNSLLSKNAAAGHEYLKLVKRSRSAHSRLMSQRTFSESTDSGDVVPEAVTSSSPSTMTLQQQQPPDHGVFSTMGERFRSFFGRKPPVHSKSLQQTTSTSSASSSSAYERRAHPVAQRSSSVIGRNPSYHIVSPTSEEDHIRSYLPQHSSEDAGSGERTSSTSSSASAKPPAMITTQNGVRLPPLGLRRRGSSENRNREFSSLGE